MAADSAEPAHPGTVAEWCAVHLGAAPVHSFLAGESAFPVWGFGLSDGRVVAIRARPASARVLACAGAQRAAATAGIGCPTLLAGPEPFGDDGLVLVAETWRDGGAVWPEEDPPGSYGRLLARIVAALAGTDPSGFVPAPLALRYDHRAAGRLWALTDGGDDPETAAPLLPPGLTRVAATARERLLASRLPPVVGHGALTGVHVRWNEGPGGVPAAVVHGWDELTARPEAVLAGNVAAVFNALPGQPRIAPVVDGERVLAAYQAQAGRDFSTDEREVAWATSAWVACHAAALEHLAGAAGQATHQIVADAALRLHLAGC